ncbi:hypothetical protein AA12717_1336 [Gluconacetobacter sacchari DSM 12717]|uniref:Uncharacterized protein n=2 Tax=Gluconacetobacter sacchari TaxID=92759 RepID=A0A7W4NTK8_9PROT|nr:hypothetical protein [Gluconacetobacter sacchari]MBB2162405.1 hypothetical protein [Gluconacetobacter sacchari]GBQ22937.1 hypothetical protein AA12717_1336 [Gluconacetobacter sacchari DSM 12717]
MSIRIDTSRLLPPLAGALAGALAIAGTGHARTHREHSIYGSISGYQAIMDRESDEYRSADAFCQTDASANMAINTSPAMTNSGGGGNQFRRMKSAYANCMVVRGAWIQITGNKPGDRPDSE